MKVFLVFLLLAGIVAAYRVGEHEGFRHKVEWMEKKQATIVSDEVAYQIKDFQRVQKIREETEYRRGHDSCGN